MKSIADNYRVRVDLPGSGWVQVYPQNNEFKWVIKQKTGYRFYQKTLETKLDFIDAPSLGLFDFSKLYNLERQGLTCQKVPIEFDVYCECDNTWSVGFYRGWLQLAKATSWNVSLCQTQIPVIVDDGYGCLTSKWGKEFNMFDYGSAPETIDPFVGVIQYKECGPEWFIDFWSPVPILPFLAQELTDQFWDNEQTDCIQGPELFTWSLVRHTHLTRYEFDYSSDSFGLNGSVTTYQKIKTRWAREFVAGVVMPDGPGWIAVTGGFARPVPVVPTPHLDLTTLEGQAALEEVWGELDGAHLGILAQWNIPGVDENGNSTLTNGKDLGSMLQAWLDQCGLTLVSNFYNINPDGSHPMNDYYTRAREDFDRLLFFQITDIARLDETVSATKALLTVKEIIDSLYIPHNTNIELDDDGVTLRWEHESYWGRVVGLNLTTKDPEILEGKNEYTHDSDVQPNSEEFGWAFETDREGGDFDGYPIEYDNACVADRENPTTDQYRSSKFITNVTHITGNPDYYDSKEIVIVAVKNDQVEQTVQPISGLAKFNGVLALGYCLPRYHDFARPFKRGLINKIDTPLFSAWRSKKQVPISFELSCLDFRDNFRAKDLIRTHLGAGELELAEWVEPQEMITVNLKHK